MENQRPVNTPVRNGVHPKTSKFTKKAIMDSIRDSSNDKPTPVRLGNPHLLARQAQRLQEQKLKAIERFIEISKMYSEHLRAKIHDKLERNNKNGNAKKSHPKLKYFENTMLRPYQQEGLTFLTVLYENNINGILGDEMGLGKTVQVIAFICYLYEKKVPGPFLIVAPLSTLGNWLSEFKRFAPKIPVVRFQGYRHERDEQKASMKTSTFTLDGREVMPVVVTSYQVPGIERKFFEKFDWHYLVVDEAHRIKNADCQLSLVLKSFHTSNRLLLTGTPLQNNITELWSLFNFLMPDLFHDKDDFSSLLLLEELQDTDKIIENEATTHVISTLHKVLAPFMLRRKKKDVLDDMVPKKEVLVYCPMTERQIYLYDAIMHWDIDALMNRESTVETKIDLDGPRPKRKCTENISYKQWTVSDYEKMEEELALPPQEDKAEDCLLPQLKCRPRMANILMMLRKIVNHPYLVQMPYDPVTGDIIVSEDLIKQSGKLLVLDALLPKLRAQKHKVLIFSAFVMFLQIVEEHLLMRNYSYKTIYGESDYEDRQKSIDAFCNDPDVFIFLISTRAGGLGLNLVAADTVIFLDRDYNPMMDLQAQDRCHRIGQTKPVMVYSLVVKNSIDEEILRRGEIKLRLEKVILKDGEFESLKKNKDKDMKTMLEDLRHLLDSSDGLTKVQANKRFYSDKQLEKILDRSDLIKQMLAV